MLLTPSGIDVEMESVEAGPIEAATDTLTRIVTVIAGWETITNAQAAAQGIARQDDADFRSTYMTRTAHSSVGSMSALEAALSEAESKKINISENTMNTAQVVQEWTIAPHSILVFAESGADGDVRRSVENHRGMGVGTTVGIVGGAPDNTVLDAVTNGTVTWAGTDYTGLDLSSAATPAAKATALTTLLDGTGVTVSYINGVYVAIYQWMPSDSPTFGTGTTEDAFGLDSDTATAPTGPFVRPSTRDLVVTADIMRRSGFPADGLARMRIALVERVDEYGVGDQVWLNDLLCAIEAVPGTRITSITVQYDSADISGVAVPANILWDLDAANITLTIT